MVALGGGHGLAATLRAVRTYTDRVTAIVSVADDGGSSGRLRQLLQIIPPGIFASAWWPWPNRVRLLASAFEYRFADEELAGHSLGNLILAGLIDGAQTIRSPPSTRPAALLGVRGRVLPATNDPVVLKADADGGSGGRSGGGDGHRQHPNGLAGARPTPRPRADAVTALAEADQIILGPGFPVHQRAGRRRRARHPWTASTAPTAPKIYVCNLRPQVPETESFDVGRHVEALVAHGVRVDVVGL